MALFSIEFIIFLIITFTSYYFVFVLNKIIKKIHISQWIVLLIASLIFYGFSNYIYLVYLTISFLVSYSAAILCQYKLFTKTIKPGVLEYEFNPKRIENHLLRKKYENIIATLSILINVGILAVLKYFNFFADSANSIFHLNINTYRFIIPLGISFYTFSLISYNVDCCKRATKAEKNPLKYLLFVCYFPKILQGPISSYDKLKQDGLFDSHRFGDNDYLTFFLRISIGLIKKIVIANVFNLYVNASYGNLDNSFGGSLLLTSVLYTIQLYCDFSGFADITIGISGLFGIKLEENFKTPYISNSISEFWRRWHITLGAWLRKYIYIPLGGNRVPIWRWIINIFVVWLISGIWHGANWTFVIWGLLQGVLIVLDSLPKQIRKNKRVSLVDHDRNHFVKILSIVGTFIIVDVGWIFFRSSNISEAFKFLLHIFQFWKPSAYFVFSDSTISKANWLFVLSIVFLIVLIIFNYLSFYKGSIISNSKKRNTLAKLVSYLLVIIFFSISIFVFVYLKSLGGGESSFIYFDF